MNCINHPDTEANGACVYCGKLFCNECLVDVNGKNYCKNCVGKAFDETKSAANITPNININNVSNSTSNANVNTGTGMYGVGISPKSRLVATLLCIFLGVIGVHRFYAGKVGTGLLYLFTGGLCGVGVLVDLFLIVLGSFRDNYGMLIKNW